MTFFTQHSYTNASGQTVRIRKNVIKAEFRQKKYLDSA